MPMFNITSISTKLTDYLFALRDLWYVLKKKRSSKIGLSIIGFLSIIALFAPIIAPYDPNEQLLGKALLSPSLEHPMGTDHLGRDIFSRVIYGSRISLTVGLLVISIGLLFGVPLGLIAGYYGGWKDNLIMRIADILFALPDFLLALFIVSIIGRGLENAIIAVGIFSIPIYARLVRGSVLYIRELEFIEGAKALGLNNFRIIFKHILPNVLPPIIVLSTLQIADAILVASALSFLGLGAQPPTPEWGAMVSTGRHYLRTAPWVSVFPGIAIFLAVIGLNLLGDGLREALDPRLRRLT
jgi:peptide/nickel transport system permease protein